MDNIQINKLPKRIRDYITSLKRQIESLDNQLKQIYGDSSKISWNVHLEESHFLPNDAKVSFHIDTSKKHGEISFGLREENGITQIAIFGDRTLKINPEASNHINLTLED